MSSSTLSSRILTLLRTGANRSDNIIAHLARVLSNSTGIEASLCTLFYTLTFLHSQLTHLLAHRYERLALKIASAASATLLPGEAFLATIEPPHLRLTEACASVKAAADATQDARIFLRLWGLLHVYTWAKKTYERPPHDAIVKLLVWMQIGVTAGFQVLDNGACLISRGVLGDGAGNWVAREKRWWARSNRLWMARVVLEMLRLMRVRQLQFNEDFGAEEVKGQGGAVQAQSKQLERKWQRELYANAGWFVPTLHWSMYDETRSPVSEAWLGMSGMIPGIIAFQDAWKETT